MVVSFLGLQQWSTNISINATITINKSNYKLQAWWLINYVYEFNCKVSDAPCTPILTHQWENNSGNVILAYHWQTSLLYYNQYMLLCNSMSLKIATISKTIIKGGRVLIITSLCLCQFQMLTSMFVSWPHESRYARIQRTWSAAASY